MKLESKSRFGRSGYRAAHRMQLAALGCIALMACACVRSVTIRQPTAQARVGDPAAFEVFFHPQAQQATFTASIDGADYTPQFSLAGGLATASIGSLSPGAHVFRAYADLPRLNFVASYQYSQSVNFVVTAPPPPSSPTFDLTLASTNQTVVWGQTASYPITVTGRNSFNDTVVLSARNLSIGTTATFSPSTVTITPGGATQSATLSLATTAVGSVATTGIGVRGVGGGATRNAQVSLAIQRTAGAFVEVTPATANVTCGVAGATLVGTGTSAAVRFTVNGAAVIPSGGLAFSQGFAISPQCRAGLLVPPPAGGAFAIAVYDLGFPTTLGRALGDRIINPVGPNVLITNFYFSPDDSLILLIGPGGSGTTQSQSATLWDLITGVPVGASQFFTGTIMSVTLTGNEVVQTGFAPGGSTYTLRWTVP